MARSLQRLLAFILALAVAASLGACAQESNDIDYGNTVEQIIPPGDPYNPVGSGTVADPWQSSQPQSIWSGLTATPRGLRGISC